MRVLYFDIDSLRHSHLGCGGYHRRTSPNIDAVAARGAVIEGLYATGTPCLPSRTAFFGGLFGAQSGVVNHGGVCADLAPEGAGRGFRSRHSEGSLASVLSRAGLHTASISGFPRRHSAYQVFYGFHETYDLGLGGLENADEVYAVAGDWVRRRGSEDNWFLHVNLWDPHTLYDTPESFGNPFEGDPIAPWLTEEILAAQRASYGPHSAREVPGYDSRMPDRWRWGRGEIASLADAKAHIDGYDTGVLYADHFVGRFLNDLADLGVLDETAVIISADHGENLGELNVWGDHQTADEFTHHIPGVVCWPGAAAAGSRVGGLHAHLDLAATIIDLAGGEMPEGHMGRSLAPALAGEPMDRGELLLSQGAWSLQRSLRWDNWLLTHTRHTGFKDFPEWMLFDLAADPHQTANLAQARPEIVAEKGPVIAAHAARLAADCPLGDPFDLVAAEGGPLHARPADLACYLPRLRETGRGRHADWLQEHGGAPRPR